MYLNAQDFFEAKFDDYKYGVISASEFCREMEDLDKYPRALMNENAKKAVNEMIPEVCKAYMEPDPGESDADRDLKFWIGLKDCFGRNIGTQAETGAIRWSIRTGILRLSGKWRSWSGRRPAKADGQGFAIRIGR